MPVCMYLYYSVVRYQYLTILRLVFICILMTVIDAAETYQNTPKYKIKSAVIALKKKL